MDSKMIVDIDKDLQSLADMVEKYKSAANEEFAKVANHDSTFDAEKYSKMLAVVEGIEDTLASVKAAETWGDAWPRSWDRGPRSCMDLIDEVEFKDMMTSFDNKGRRTFSRVDEGRGGGRRDATRPMYNRCTFCKVNPVGGCTDCAELNQ